MVHLRMRWSLSSLGPAFVGQPTRLGVLCTYFIPGTGAAGSGMATPVVFEAPSIELMLHGLASPLLESAQFGGNDLAAGLLGASRPSPISSPPGLNGMLSRSRLSFYGMGHHDEGCRPVAVLFGTGFMA
uniref:Uncharacterized protein n=1 Tax=Sphaerodactylus townsendi TaxID=933632 RepID=A0ACB8G349_9SAUR